MSKFAGVFIALTVFLAVAAEEKKKEPCICVDTLEIRPVCGTDNVTYVNPGALRCENQCEGKDLKIKSYGPCPCVCINTREYLPVCGSDDKTYVNPGAIRCHNRCRSTDVKLVAYKPCRKDDLPLPY